MKKLTSEKIITATNLDYVQDSIYRICDNYMLPEDTFILNDDGTITLKQSVVSGMEPALARDVYDALGELLRKWR